MPNVLPRIPDSTAAPARIGSELQPSHLAPQETRPGSPASPNSRAATGQPRETPVPRPSRHRLAIEPRPDCCALRRTVGPPPTQRGTPRWTRLTCLAVHTPLQATAP